MMTPNYRGRLGVVGAPATSQAEIAYDAIKQDILTCVIKPKQRLTEADLAERYRLGRASIRVALNRLYQEALIDVLPRYGYVVAGDDEMDAQDLYQLQLVLETTSARLAAGRADARQLIELDRACADATNVDSIEDATRFLHANTNFHVAIATATGNALLARFVRILFERLERHIYASGRAEEIVRHVAHTHEDVIELLVEGRAEEVEEAVRRQVGRNYDIIRAVASGRDPNLGRSV